MIKRLLPLISIFVLAVPVSTYALEQSFSRNGLRATVKLSPGELKTGERVNLALKLERDGQPLTDRKVILEVYEKDAAEPMLKREVDPLEEEYVDSWSFEKPGEYRVAVSIADPQKPGEELRYEVKASVGEAKDAGHGGHDFFSHHFGGGKWGWWGAGLMLLIMVPMMLI